MVAQEKTGFEGFRREHFLAFEDSKQASHRFNLERMKVADALDSLKASLLGTQDGVDDFAWAKSSTHPEVLNGNRVEALWLYLERAGHDREVVERACEKELSIAAMISAPHTMHRFAFCGLRIDGQFLSWGFWLHSAAALDRKNLDAALRDPFERSKLPPLLGRLPSGCTLTLDGLEELAPEALASMENGLPAFVNWLFIGRRLPLDAVIDRGPAILDTLLLELPPMAALFRWCVWTAKNDRLNLGKQLKQEKKEVVRKRSGLAQGDRVSISRGILAGQTGIVQELDARGQAKILIGRITVEMSADMLVKKPGK